MPRFDVLIPSLTSTNNTLQSHWTSLIPLISIQYFTLPRSFLTSNPILLYFHLAALKNLIRSRQMMATKNTTLIVFRMLGAMVKVTNTSSSGEVMVKNMINGYQDLNCKTVRPWTPGWRLRVGLLELSRFSFRIFQLVAFSHRVLTHLALGFYLHFY